MHYLAWTAVAVVLILFMLVFSLRTRSSLERMERAYCLGREELAGYLRDEVPGCGQDTGMGFPELARSAQAALEERIHHLRRWKRLASPRTLLAVYGSLLGIAALSALVYLVSRERWSVYLLGGSLILTVSAGGAYLIALILLGFFLGTYFSRLEAQLALVEKVLAEDG